jgi:hypothetical protein
VQHLVWPPLHQGKLFYNYQYVLADPAAAVDDVKACSASAATSANSANANSCNDRNV